MWKRVNPPTRARLTLAFREDGPYGQRCCRVEEGGARAVLATEPHGQGAGTPEFCHEGSAPATCVTLVGRDGVGRPVSTYGSPGWVRESRRRGYGARPTGGTQERPSASLAGSSWPCHPACLRRSALVGRAPPGGSLARPAYLPRAGRVLDHREVAAWAGLVSWPHPSAMGGGVGPAGCGGCGMGTGCVGAAREASRHRFSFSHCEGAGRPALAVGRESGGARVAASVLPGELAGLFSLWAARVPRRECGGSLRGAASDGHPAGLNSL